MATPNRGRRGSVPNSLRLYRGLSQMIAPLVSLLLAQRLRRGKEDGARLHERKGHAILPRPAGPLIWLHAASVGETMSILPLIARLRAQGQQTMLTTGTLSSAQLAASRLPEGAFHQFVPVDTLGAVRRFLDHWRPDLAIFCESEIWPNLMYEPQRRGIPTGIVNGRMSDRSFARWRRLSGLVTPLLDQLAFCLVQNAQDAERFNLLGAPAQLAGNLKYDVPALPVEPGAYATLRAAIGGRPVFFAASTHAGEEAAMIAASRMVLRESPTLLTIIAPRHPERGDSIAALIEAAGLPLARRSRGEAITASTPIYLADTLGEMGLFFSLAELAFIGGTLVPIGGHNPIEAAKFGVPVLHGPHIHKSREVFAALHAVGGAIEVADAQDLEQRLRALLADPSARNDLEGAGARFIAAQTGALERTLVAIAPFLPETPGTS